MFAEHLSSKTRTLKMRARTSSLGAVPKQRFRAAHSVSQAVVSHFKLLGSGGSTTLPVTQA
jgi:hypothetical protein